MILSAASSCMRVSKRLREGEGVRFRSTFKTQTQGQATGPTGNGVIWDLSEMFGDHQSIEKHV